MAKAARVPKTPTTAERLGSVLKSCRRILRQDKGLSGDLDRLPLLTWVMFLKFLDDLELVEEDRAALRGEPYRPVIAPPYRWRDWAAADDGMTGPELIAFLNQEETTRPDGTRGPGLFTYLSRLQNGATSRKRVVATVFGGLANRVQSGYLLRQVVNEIDKIHFESHDELFTLGHLYESMLREMRDAAGDSGEFYTPRAVVRFMVEAIDPRLGEVVLDPACGTGGFLAEAYTYLGRQVNTVEDRKVLQTTSILGGEAKPLPYLLAQMNLLLHGLEAPQIDPGNSLRFPLHEIGDRERVDVILTNPPFGGEEERGILSNFPEGMQTTETAILFLQLIMRRLRRAPKPGRAAVVVPNGTLFGDGVAARVKEQLLKDFRLHTIVRLPEGVFAPYTEIPTNILFFDRSGPTDEIWYYEVPGPADRRKYTKTKPLQFEDLADALAWYRLPVRTEGPHAWRVDAADVLAVGANLDVKNPHAAEAEEHRPPAEIVDEMLAKHARLGELLRDLRDLVGE